MSKITVVGGAAAIISTLKLEDLKTIQKYRPKSLTLMGGENNKEPIFVIGAGTGNGELNGNGAYFTEHTHDEEKLACITISLSGVQGDVKEYIADRFGEAIANLNKMEESLPAVLDEVQAQKATVMESITIA